VAKSGWDVIKQHPISATDSYGFATLIFEVFNGSVIDKDQIGQTKGIPPTMHQSYKRLLNVNPKARLSVSHFRDQGRRSGGFFETPLIRFSEAIESLGLRSEGEREEILRQACDESSLPRTYHDTASSTTWRTNFLRSLLGSKCYLSF
jgi:SCY1-like protein 1